MSHDIISIYFRCTYSSITVIEPGRNRCSTVEVFLDCPLQILVHVRYMLLHGRAEVFGCLRHPIETVGLLGCLVLCKLTDLSFFFSFTVYPLLTLYVQKIKQNCIYSTFLTSFQTSSFPFPPNSNALPTVFR